MISKLVLLLEIIFTFSFLQIVYVYRFVCKHNWSKKVQKGNCLCVWGHLSYRTIEEKTDIDESILRIFFTRFQKL